MGWIKQRPPMDIFVPFSQTFTYTGGVQTLIVPTTGLYKLEVWGARGGYSSTYDVYTNNKGGHSVGYKKLTAGTVLYIVCGGMGGQGGEGFYGGGYNGGGTAKVAGYPAHGSAGGGATHIALVSGTLASIGKVSFDADGLIVAGGGGGYYSDNYNGFTSGGSGGGLSGANGSTSPNTGEAGGTGGTQNSGFAFGQGANGTNNQTGGGGGYYGGNIAYYKGAGGGSGWIDGVPSITYKGVTYTPTTENNINAGNGYALIERVA